MSTLSNDDLSNLEAGITDDAPLQAPIDKLADIQRLWPEFIEVGMVRGGAGEREEKKKGKEEYGQMDVVLDYVLRLLYAACGAALTLTLFTIADSLRSE